VRPRFIVEWTNEDGKSWRLPFTNKVRMIRHVMYLTFQAGSRSVRWREGDHRDQGVREGWMPIPENIGPIGLEPEDGEPERIP